MSIPRVAPSLTLAQRLDTLLGTRIAQQISTPAQRASVEDVPRALAPSPVETGPHVPQRAVQPAPQPGARHTAPHTPSPPSTDAGRIAARTIGAGPDTTLTPSAPTSLGPTAQILAQVLQRFPAPVLPASLPHPLLDTPPQATSTGTGNASATTVPLGGGLVPSTLATSVPSVLQFSSPLAAQFFQALQQHMQHSGLFYESHLARFAQGQYPRHQLQAEPQAQLAPTTEPAHAASLHPDATLTVRQQLEILAHQMVSWRGEAWPDTDLYWDVLRESGDDTPAEPDATNWSSQLKLSLPKLGDVHIRLQLTGNQLKLRVAAPQSQSLLATQSGTLRQQLQATGLNLQQLHISADLPDTATPQLAPAAVAPGADPATPKPEPRHE